MELGYNTDITLPGGKYHVQTEGRLDSNPRVETLVYKDGAVLQRVSNPDEELGADDQRIEETKRKIRDQHLSVVGLVRREDLDRVASVQPAKTAYDFLDLLPPDISADWRDVLKGRHETMFEAWKRAMADAVGLGTPNPRHAEFRRILDAFARFLLNDAVDFHRKQGLLSYLLRLDARFKVVDFYEAFRQEKSEVREYEGLTGALKAGTDRLVDLLILQSSEESALADELVLELFAKQSLEIVKYLFAQAEKKLTGNVGESQEVLPTVLLYLEEKVGSENIPARELDDLFDRLNYLYARLSVKVVREISSRIQKIRKERGFKAQLRAGQKKKVKEYADFLESCKAQIEKEGNLEKKLIRISEFKSVIDGWDKVLRLYIDLRLALKGYHNLVTVNILETAEMAALKLKKVMSGLSEAERNDVEPVLAELQHSLDARLDVRKIVVPAIKAQEYLQFIETGQFKIPPKQERVPAAKPVAASEPKVKPPVRPPAQDAVPRKASIRTEATRVTQETVEKPVALEGAPQASVSERVTRLEERVKVGALQLLRSIEELTRATQELSRLEGSPEITAQERARLANCRRELALKKKVLQHRLASL